MSMVGERIENMPADLQPVRKKQARPEREKNVCGKVVTLKEKPATKVVKMHATKDFQQKVV